MKIKIFDKYYADNLEFVVNQWLKYNDNIEIKNILQAEDKSIINKVYYTLTIFYEEKI